jgi:hypothetical protein
VIGGSRSQLPRLAGRRRFPPEAVPPRHRVRRSLGTAAIAAAGALASVGASAAPADAPSHDRLATARELFVQAEHAEDEGRWQDALDTLRQVALVKLTAGVRYHIALCEEHLDLLANALEDFAVAKEQAVLEHAPDVLRLVGGEIDALTPRVPRLAIHLTPEGPEASVTLDGEALDVAHLGESRPVNPGVRRIEARVLGRRPASVVVTMHERDATALEIPLAELPAVSLPPAPRPAAAAAKAPPATVSANGWTSARVDGLVGAVAAAVLSGGGAGAYLAAGRAHDDAVASCAGIVDPSPSACDGKRNAVRAWDWVAASAWAGAAVSAGLAVYFWTRPAPSGGGAALTWVVGVGFVGVRGNF